MGVIAISTPFLLFLASEKMIGQTGGKVSSSLENPADDTLAELAWELSGTDESSRRWSVFKKAFESAETKFLMSSHQPESARAMLDILDALGDYAKTNDAQPGLLSSEFSRLSLIGREPDVDRLVDLCVHASLSKGIQPPTRVDLMDMSRTFLSAFRDTLFSDPAYREFSPDLDSKEATPMSYNTRADYLAQIRQIHQHLDFAGLDETGYEALKLEDVFIGLRAAVETQSDARGFKERVRKYQLDNERRSIGKGRPEKTIQRLSVNQALGGNSNLVVLGDPGAGKTVLLKYVTLAFAENQPARLGLDEARLPIFVHLYDYAAKRAEYPGAFSLLDYLRQFSTSKLSLNLPGDFFEDALERGECCVCFDGLDELGTLNLRRELVTVIEALVARYPRNRYIVASRLLGYEQAPLERREFTHLTLQPLGAGEIRRFLEKWYILREKDLETRQKHIARLTDTILEHERIRTLAANPLILTIIALEDRPDIELPQERVRLYERCVSLMIETWDHQPGIKHALRRRLLEKLAYWMHTQPGIPPIGALEQQLRHFLVTDPKLQLDEEQVQREVDAFLAHIKTRGGLLVERSVGVYSFSHLIFQEFLAASDIEKRLAHSSEALWNEIQPRLHDAHWREVILLLLGSLNRFEQHNTDLVRRIYQSSDPYEPIVHRHLFLAARTLADYVEVDAVLRNDILDSLLTLAASQELAAWDAFAPLGNLHEDRRAALGLLALAQDDKANLGTRLFAAQALGQLGRADDEARILLGLAHDEKVHADVRSTATQALGQLGRASELVLNGLLALAQDEKAYAYVRSDAAQALGRIGQADSAILTGLLGLVRDEKVNERVRRAATHALGNIEHDDQVIWSELLALARDEKADRGVRSAAAQTLGSVDDPSETVLSGLLALAGDVAIDDRVRCDAADALAQLGWVEHASQVLLTLARDEAVSFWVRSDAASILGRLGRTDESAEVLLGLLYDEKVDARIRSDATDVLARLGTTSAAVMDGLLTLAQNESVDLRLRSDAVQAVGELGRTEAAVQLLEGFARDESVAFWVRGDAAEALGELGCPEKAAAVLLALANDEKVNVGGRSAMAQALGQLGYADSAVLSGLLALAQNESMDSGVRSDAAQALGQLGRVDESVLAGLLTLVKDEKTDACVRSDAAQSLGVLRHADESVLSGLAGLAADEQVDAWVRIDAAQALAQLGRSDEGVLVGLLSLVRDESRTLSMRNAAYHGLRDLLGEGK